MDGASAPMELYSDLDSRTETREEIGPMLNLYLRIRNVVEEDTGAALAEYGLLVALIAVVCIGAVTVLGTGVSGSLGDAAAGL